MAKHNCMKFKILFLPILFLSTLMAQNINVSNGLAFDGEPYMVIDPVNSNHIVVAWIGFSFGQPVGIKTKVSTNGGNSWSSHVFLPHGAPTYHSADPSMAYDANGDLWACYIDYREAPDSGGVYLVKSTDGGFTWGSFVKAIDAYDDGLEKPIDRPWFAIDKVNNDFFITSKPPPWIPAPNRNYITKSLDGGTTWEPWRYIDTSGFLIGNLIAQPMAAVDVGPDGKLHVMYPSYEPSQNILPGYIHASSTNNAVNFQYHPAAYALPGPTDTLAKLGYNLKVDPSDANHLAFTYCFRPSVGDFDVYCMESTNGGVNWLTPVRVNDDPIGNGKIQDLVWCDFDTDGDLIVGWRDRRNGSNNTYATESEIWGAVKWNDSTNFSANFPIADSLVNYQAVLAQNGNDFMNIAMRNDTMYAVWGDVRTGVLQIWFARKSLITGVTSVESIASENIPQVRFYPNPAFQFIQIEAKDLLQTEVFDMHGKLMFTSSLPQLNRIDISEYPTGNYLLRFKAKQGIVERKLIKQ